MSSLAKIYEVEIRRNKTRVKYRREEKKEKEK